MKATEKSFGASVLWLTNLSKGQAAKFIFFGPCKLDKTVAWKL